MFKINSKDTSVFITINFQHIAHLVLLFLLLIFTCKTFFKKYWYSIIILYKFCKCFLSDAWILNGQVF